MVTEQLTTEQDTGKDTELLVRKSAALGALPNRQTRDIPNPNFSRENDRSSLLSSTSPCTPIVQPQIGQDVDASALATLYARQHPNTNVSAGPFGGGNPVGQQVEDGHEARIVSGGVVLSGPRMSPIESLHDVSVASVAGMAVTVGPQQVLPPRKRKRQQVEEMLHKEEVDGRYPTIVRMFSRDKAVCHCVLRTSGSPPVQDDEDIMVLSKCLAVNETMHKLRLYLHDGVIGKRGWCWFAFVMAKYNRTLQELDLSGNTIGEEGAFIIANILAKNTAIKVLKLTRCAIPPKGVATMCKILECTNKTLERLDLGANTVSSGGARYIGEMLKSNTTMVDLNLANSTIRHPKSIRHLQEALIENKTLRSLNLSHNNGRKLIRVGQGLPCMASVVTGNDSLSNIDLSHNLVSLARVARTLRQNSNIRYLGLDNVGLVDNAAHLRLLCDALTESHTLEHIQLAQNGIDDSHAVTIASVFARNESITKIDLSSNLMEGVGMTALASALSHNRRLQTLLLESNRIGDGGAAALAHLLEQNPALTEVSVESNGIGASGGMAIAYALAKNTCLEQLNVADNEIGEVGGTAFGKALEVNRTLKALNMSHNGTGAMTARALAVAIRTNPVLSSIGIRSRGQTFESVAELLGAVAQSDTLTELNLIASDNDIVEGEDDRLLPLMGHTLLARHNLVSDMDGSRYIRFLRFLNRVGFWKLVVQDVPLGMLAVAMGNLYRPRDSELAFLEGATPLPAAVEQWDLDVVFFLCKNRPDMFDRKRCHSE